MTDRYNALTVILDTDLRSDDAKSIIDAISQIRHVLKVEPHVTNIDYVAEARIRRELGEALFNVIYPERNKS